MRLEASEAPWKQSPYQIVILQQALFVDTQGAFRYFSQVAGPHAALSCGWVARAFGTIQTRALPGPDASGDGGYADANGGEGAEPDGPLDLGAVRAVARQHLPRGRHDHGRGRSDDRHVGSETDLGRSGSVREQWPRTVRRADLQESLRQR